uniref:Sir2-b n=1 Tax=Phallusia mammillata TaxID=59560 RepID=A0A6F9DSD3_9ASCI|nr:Sir2-b [Phallusia mammillata]
MQYKGVQFLPVQVLHRCYTSMQTASGNGLETPERFHPKAAPPSQTDISTIKTFVAHCKNMMVLSGAGLSTESGVPDYRSKGVGLYDRMNHKPMEHHEFVRSSASRKKYWARNYIGWKRLSSLKPNIAHTKLSQLEKDGKISWHVTQNVDSLCSKAGSKKLTELHGCVERVTCLSCRNISTRKELQKRFQENNSTWSANVLGFGPDADVFIKDEDVTNFHVPACLKCGGVLKPDVTFFGDNVPGHIVEFVYDKLQKSDGLLVVGSSLQVWSGYRFVSRASHCGIPIAIINIGATRADDITSVKVNALCTQVLKHIL